MQINSLKTSVVLLNKKAKFSCSADNKPEIIIDYTPPVGDGEGYTSLELLLLELLLLELEADDVSKQELEQVISNSEKSLCPVYDMIRGNTEFSVKYKTKCGG